MAAQIIPFKSRETIPPDAAGSAPEGSVRATYLKFPAPRKPARGKLLWPDQKDLPRFTVEEWGPEDRTGGETRLELTTREYRQIRAFLRKLRHARKPLQSKTA